MNVQKVSPHLAESAMENGQRKGEGEHITDSLTHLYTHQTERIRQNHHQRNEEKSATCRR